MIHNTKLIITPVKMVMNSLQLSTFVRKLSKFKTLNLIYYTRSNKLQNFQPLIVSYHSLHMQHKFMTSKSLTSFIRKEMHEQKQKGQEEEDFGKELEMSWRSTKYTFIGFAVSFSMLLTYLVYELGRNSTDEQGNIIIDEFSDLPIYKRYIYRTWKELCYYTKMLQEPSREKLLPDPVKPPYYQPPYTLVMEMSDVLVHPDHTYETGWRFKKRPGLDYFLENLRELFEIVVYTAEHGCNVFPLMEALDPKNLITYKLVRDATYYVDGHHVKDLNRLNRDLKKVIVMDWNAESVKFHPDNLFHLDRWKGNDDDTTLIDLTAFLITVAQSQVEDVRDVLKYYQQFEQPLNTFREKQKQLLQIQETERQAQKDKPMPDVKRWTSGFF